MFELNRDFVRNIVVNLAPEQRQYRFEAKAEKDRGEILLYSDIGPSDWGMVDAQAFGKVLKSLGDVSVIDLRINSYGGFVDEGIAIYNQLARHPARVEVTVDGIAASIASVIAMAGETIAMNRGTRMMVHEASSLAWGNKRSMRKEADVLEAYDDSIVDIYAHRTGLARDELIGLMEAETWMSASKAVERGFADSVDEAAEPVENRLSPMGSLVCKHPPKDLLGQQRTAMDRAGATAKIASMSRRLGTRAKAGA